MQAYLLHPQCQAPHALADVLRALDPEVLQVCFSAFRPLVGGTADSYALIWTSKAVQDPSLTIIQRCLRVAQFFGNENGSLPAA